MEAEEYQVLASQSLAQQVRGDHFGGDHNF